MKWRHEAEAEPFGSHRGRQLKRRRCLGAGAKTADKIKDPPKKV